MSAHYTQEVRVAFLMGLMGVALMALPPMDGAMRDGQASVIVTAEVIAVYEAEAPVKWGTDTHYVIQARVKTSKKGDLAEGALIYVHAEQPKKRPDGWTGPQGQNHVPAAGSTATFYLRRSPDKQLSALSPNGIDP